MYSCFLRVIPDFLRSRRIRFLGKLFFTRIFFRLMIVIRKDCLWESYKPMNFQGVENWWNNWIRMRLFIVEEFLFIFLYDRFWQKKIHFFIYFNRMNLFAILLGSNKKILYYMEWDESLSHHFLAVVFKCSIIMKI